LAIKAAKELTIKAAKAKVAKANDEAKDGANKAEPKAKKSADVTQAGTKQKIRKQAVPDIKQKAAAAPVNAKRCIVSFPGARVVLALFFAATMALRSNSSMMPTGVAEVVTPKSNFSLANDQQCGRVYDDDDSCAVQEAFETTCSVPTLPPLEPSP
jgi:hypothetical protein